MLNVRSLICCSAEAVAEIDQLHAFRISNEALKTSDLPTRLKLLNWGENQSLKGTLKVGGKTLAALSATQKSLGFDRIALDFDHNSVPGSKTFQPSPRKHAAYGTPVVVEGDGLYLESIEWTPSGQEFAREYSDLSPTVAKDADGEVTFVHSVALCTQGSVEGLTFYSAAFLQPQTTQPHSTSSMDYKKLICTLLGIPAESDDAAIQKAAESFGKKESTEHKGDPALETLSARLDRVESAAQDGERSRLVERATHEGKVIPLSADDLKSIPLTTLSVMIDKLPVTVPLTARTTPVVESHSVSAPTAIQSEIRKNLGISEETWKKHNS